MTPTKICCDCSLYDTPPQLKNTSSSEVFLFGVQRYYLALNELAARHLAISA